MMCSDVFTLGVKGGKIRNFRWTLNTSEWRVWRTGLILSKTYDVITLRIY